MHLTWLDLTVIVVYFGVLLAMGVYFSSRQTSRLEYSLGGRSIHWLLAGGSIMATLISTISYLSIPGEMIRYGVAYFTGFLALPLVVPIVNRVLIPAFMRLPITSAYEYLERRFGGEVRTVGSAVFVTKTAIWMGLVIYTASWALAAMTGWSLLTVIVVTGAATTFYATVGGLRSVIWTDNLQLWILLGGVLLIPIYVGFAIGSGPLGWWETFAQAGRTEIQTFSMDLTVRITVIGIMCDKFFWTICTSGSDQLTVQRYLSTPSLAAARRSVWTFTVAHILLAAALGFCGLALFAFYASHASGPIQLFQADIASRADQVLPVFIAEQLPSGITGLMLAALLAAAMSSYSSGINSISGVVVTDYVERYGLFSRFKGSLFLDKLTSVLVGMLGIVTATLIASAMRHSSWNLVELSGRINHVFVGPLAVIFFAGILLRRVGRRASLTGFLASLATSLCVAFGEELFGMAEGISFMWVTPLSFVAGLAAAWLSAYLFTAPPEEEIRRLTYSGTADSSPTPRRTPLA